MEPKKRIIPVFVPHLGCPNDCVFCNQRKISGRLSPASAQTVEAELRSAAKKLPEGTPAELAFYGGSFTAIPENEQEELLGAASPFLRSGLIDSIRVSTRPDCIDETVLARLRRFGVGTIELGAQSMDDDVLLLSGRGHTAEDTRAAAEKIKTAGFELMLQMMTGLPGDTPEKSLYTARELAALMPSGVRIYPTVIIRDTALYDMWKAGLYKEHTVEDAVDLCARIVPVFEEKGIKIIRLGLNPTDDLSAGEAAAGAYHPALGALVYSRIYLNKARELLRGHEGESLVVGVGRGKTPLFTGHKRENILALTREFSLRRLKVREEGSENGDICILEIEKQ